jgi:hypothetical protein
MDLVERHGAHAGAGEDEPPEEVVGDTGLQRLDVGTEEVELRAGAVQPLEGLVEQVGAVEAPLSTTFSPSSSRR